MTLKNCVATYITNPSFSQNFLLQKCCIIGHLLEMSSQILCSNLAYLRSLSLQGNFPMIHESFLQKISPSCGAILVGAKFIARTFFTRFYQFSEMAKYGDILHLLKNLWKFLRILLHLWYHHSLFIRCRSINGFPAPTCVLPSVRMHGE